MQLFEKYFNINTNIRSRKKGINMTRISEEERYLFEQAIYLPMVLTILNRDNDVVQQAPFKLKKPYLTLIEETMKAVQKELFQIKKQMSQKRMKVVEIERDEAFTQFLFVTNNWEENHNYFNPKIRNEVQQLLQKYLLRE